MWIIFQGFKYLYLTPEDFKKVSAMNSVQCEHLEENGESRYRIKTVVGHTDGLGVENLSGSGMIAGETSQAYNEVVTFNLVSVCEPLRVRGDLTGLQWGHHLQPGECAGTSQAYNEVVTFNLVSVLGPHRLTMRLWPSTWWVCENLSGSGEIP